MPLHDPDAGRLDVEPADVMLGMEERDRELVRLAAAIDVILTTLGIEPDLVEAAYQQRLKTQILAVRDDLDALVRGGIENE